MVEDHVPHGITTVNVTGKHRLLYFPPEESHKQCLLTLAAFPLFQHSHASTEATETSVSSIQIESGYTTDQTNESGLNLKDGLIDKNTTTNEVSTGMSLNSLCMPPKYITQTAEQSLPTPSLFACLFDRKYLRSIILGIGFPVLCQLTGVSVFASYSTTILQNTGMERAILGSVTCGSAAVIGSIVSVFLFHRFSRKAMACVSFSAMAMCCLALSLSDLAPTIISGLFSVICIFGFVFFYASVCSTLHTGLPTEILPPEVASAAFELGRFLSWLCAFIIVLISPAILDAAGALWLYLAFFASCFVSLLFWKCAIEPKEQELKDIVEELMNMPDTSVAQRFNASSITFGVHKP